MRDLSPKDADTLACLQHRGSEDLSKLARLLRTKEPALRNSLQRLKDLEIVLGRYPFIDSMKLGYSDFAFYFSLSPKKTDRTEDFLKGLSKSNLISWIGVLGGSFQYSASLLARNADHAWNEVARLSKQHEIVFAQRKLLVRRRFLAFPRKYLATSKYAHPELGYEYPSSICEIDNLDHRILSSLCTSPDLSLRSLSEKLHHPLTTVSRRISQLKSRGIIRGFIYRYDLTTLGYCTFRALLRTREISGDFSQKIEKFSRQHPNVLRYMEMFGEWDYELEIEVSNSKQILKVIDQINREFTGEIEGFELLQVFEHRKFSGYPFALS